MKPNAKPIVEACRAKIRRWNNEVAWKLDLFVDIFFSEKLHIGLFKTLSVDFFDRKMKMHKRFDHPGWSVTNPKFQTFHDTTIFRTFKVLRAVFSVFIKGRFNIILQCFHELILIREGKKTRWIFEILIF